MPLSGIGLCEADSITPMSADSTPVRYATAGVGRTPTRTTLAPALANPATTAASSISPLALGSRPTSANGWCEESAATSVRTAATAIAIASSGPRSALARPRTPSVPKRRPVKFLGSALRVLRSLAGLLEAVLLALLDTRVTGEEAGLLEGRAVLDL